MKPGQHHRKRKMRNCVILYFSFVAACVAGTQEPASLVFPPYGHSYGIRKATPKHLFMFFGPTTAFDDPQGLATAKMIARDDPSTSKDDDEVVVYGVNSGRHQLIYNTTMWTLAIYGSKGAGKDQLLNPKGIATDAEGNVVIADWGNNRIVVLFNPKREVRWVRAFNGKKNADPGLVHPLQVVLTKEKNIFVTDSGNHRLVRFDLQGQVLGTIPSSNQFAFEDGPTTLAIADGNERWSYFSGERFLVCADRRGTRLRKVSFDGTLIKAIDVPAGHRTEYAATDYYHNIWITDIENHCILKYDHDLNLLDIFGSKGEGDNQFIEPRGIAIWKRYGQTFIAEKTGAQYYWIGTKCNSRRLERNAGGSLDVKIGATEYSYISIFRAQKADTTFLLRRFFIHPGSATAAFSDKSGNGQLMLKIEPTYSSYTYYAWYFPMKPQ